MKTTKELLGGRIRELRKGQNMTQERLSELVDVDPRYISRIEIGNCFPSLEKLVAISQALQAEMRDLFDYEPQTGDLNIKDEMEGLINSVEDEKQKKLILKITKAVKKAVLNNV